MLKHKGGAANRGLSNDDYNFLYGLGFDDGDIEMMEFYNPYIRLNEIIGEYIRVASENYNINLNNIEAIALNNIQQLPNSNVTKRDVAREVIYFFSNQGRTNGGNTRKSLKRKSRRIKKRLYTLKSKRNRRRYSHLKHK